MYELKIVTTVFIVFLMLMIAMFFMKSTWQRNKASIIGFGFMEVVYVLGVVCMWL